MNKDQHFQYLCHAALLGRLSHAYLLSGNDREAKKNLVSQFLQRLFCEKEEKPCRNCTSCFMTEKGIHPDETFIAPDKEEITIDQIRDLKTRLSLSPWQAPFKVAVLKDSHLMNQEAQSALLKLLEEPKGNTLFFLLSEHPAMMLPTILSRVQELRLYRFPEVPERKDREWKTLRRLSFHERFSLAKEKAEGEEGIKGILVLWLWEARQELMEALEQSAKERVRSLYRMVKLLQTIIFLSKTQNINSRIALERILIEL